jgi:hypothetical protein
VNDSAEESSMQMLEFSQLAGFQVEFEEFCKILKIDSFLKVH